MEIARLDEGDHWRLDGKKIFITNAKEADIFVVFANVDPELGYKGVPRFSFWDAGMRWLQRSARRK
jgi:alkylation response protein AidB-like acyl-CoA dehydrogenase